MPTKPQLGKERVARMKTSNHESSFNYMVKINIGVNLVAGDAKIAKA